MTVKDNENTIPKIYTYTVDGFYTEHENEENEKELKRFSIPSFGRDLTNESDLESEATYAAQCFYLDYPEYKDITKWPLLFKFYVRKNSKPVEIEMNLSFSPCFMSTPRQIRVTKEELKKKKTNALVKEDKNNSTSATPTSSETQNI